MHSTSNPISIVNTEQLFDRLNAEQKEAVSLKWGPSLVIAGAGSGKTTVLTRRVAYLLSELKAPASSILCVTFTNKAAAEMRDRLEKLVGERTARQLTIGTFHSVCARLLRNDIEGFKSPEGYSWKNNYVIYDETDTLSIVKDVIGKLNLDDKMYPPREMRQRISSFKNDGISAAEYARDARRYADQKFSDIYTNYQAALARNNALDFDDLILTFTQLLQQNEEVRTQLQQRFKHVLVDEFQDTNQSQYKLIRFLSPAEKTAGADLTQFWTERTLMVVGDVDQSIYSWRKADFRIILGFQNDYQSSRLIKLEHNYRSTSTILDVANSIIKNNTERIDKVLRCNKGKGGKVRVHAGTDEIDEAYFIAEEVKRLKVRGVSLSNCSILYRTNALSRAVEEVLVRSHIPYTMVGGTRFYERAEIKDVISYLKFIYNPLDSQAFLRCIASPKRGIGKTSLDHLIEFAERENIGPLEACLQSHRIPALAGKASKGLSEFGVMAERWHNMSKLMPVKELLELVLTQSGYLKKLKDDAAEAKDELAAGRVENVEELLAVAEEFEQIADEPTLEAFLTRISLVSDLDALKAGEDAVKLMTLHSAKGLEFENVFLIGLEDGLFPHKRTLDQPKELEEERRLMYVGVTRAEERLYLTYSRKRASYMQGGNGGFSNYTIPSRFLNEIDPDKLMGLETLPDIRELESGYGHSEGRAGYGRGGSGDWQENRYGRSGADDWQQNRYGRSGNDYGRAGSAAGNDSRYGRGGSQDSGKYGAAARSGYGTGSGAAARPSSPPPQSKPRVLSRSGAQPPAEPSNTFSSTGNSAAPATDFERLKVGEKVMHTKFGVGTVAEVIGDGDKELYAVKFESSGKRVLDPRFARLVKLT